MMHFYLLLLAADAGRKPEHVTIAEDELAPAKEPQGNLLQEDIDFVTLLIASLLGQQEKKESSATKASATKDLGCIKYKDAMSCKNSNDHDCTWMEDRSMCTVRQTCTLAEGHLPKFSTAFTCNGQRGVTSKTLDIGDMCVPECEEFTTNTRTGYITCVPGKDEGVLLRLASCNGLAPKALQIIVSVGVKPGQTCAEARKNIAKAYGLDDAQVVEISCTEPSTTRKTGLRLLSSSADEKPGSSVNHIQHPTPGEVEDILEKSENDCLVGNTGKDCRAVRSTPKKETAEENDLISQENDRVCEKGTDTGSCECGNQLCTSSSECNQDEPGLAICYTSVVAVADHNDDVAGVPIKKECEDAESGEECLCSFHDSSAPGQYKHWLCPGPSQCSDSVEMGTQQCDELNLPKCDGVTTMEQCVCEEHSRLTTSNTVVQCMSGTDCKNGNVLKTDTATEENYAVCVEVTVPPAAEESEGEEKKM